MTNPNRHNRDEVVLRSGAIAAVLATLGLVVLASDRPVLVEVNNEGPIRIGQTVNHSTSLRQIPHWLVPPNRSTAAHGNPSARGTTKHLFLQTLSSAAEVENHYREMLTHNGLQIAVVRPRKSELGLVAIIDAYDDATGRFTQIMIRDVGAVRAIEISYRDPKSRTTDLT